MPNATCPYCDKTFDHEFDGGWPDDGETVEIECSKCSKIFHASACISLDLLDERKVPCKNGESDHKWERVHRYPIIIRDKVGIRCKHCGGKKEVPWQDCEKYGYNMDEVKKDVEWPYRSKPAKLDNKMV